MSERPTPRLSRRWKIVIVSVVFASAAGAFGIYWFLSSDPPPPVDIEAIADLASTTSTTVASDTEATLPADPDEEPLGSPEGSWIVDTSVGEFSVTEETAASFVGFRVDEVLRGIGSTTAVGRTPLVDGSLEIEGTTLLAVEIVADLTALVSNESRRDGAVQRSLDTRTHRTTVFTLAEPIDLGDGATEGEIVRATARGTLTVKGITREVEVPIEAQGIGDRILVVGSLTIFFDDYDVTPPSAAAVLSVEDHGIIEFQLWFSRTP